MMGVPPAEAASLRDPLDFLLGFFLKWGLHSKMKWKDSQVAMMKRFELR